MSKFVKKLIQKLVLTRKIILLKEYETIFLIAPMLARFYGQNPKIAISQERLKRFQKYLRFDTFHCYSMTKYWTQNSDLHGPPSIDVFR